MSKKSNHYFTFGQEYRTNEHPNFPEAHPDGWVTIIAEDWLKAREKAGELFGLKDGCLMFSFQYDDNDFTPEYFPMGEIARFES